MVCCEVRQCSFWGLGRNQATPSELRGNKTYVVEQDARNSAVPLLDKRDINARIEPGAIIRDQVEIGDNAVIMMGAVINIGAEIGAGTMIDMGAILGAELLSAKTVISVLVLFWRESLSRLVLSQFGLAITC